MKFIALALIMVLLTVSANFHNLRHKSGDDIYTKLTSGNHDIYVLVFFHPEAGHDHLRNTNRHLIDNLENEFLHKNDIKDLYYATIDVTNPTYAHLLDELTIETEDLINSPQLFIMEHGNGFVMTGPRAVSELKQNLNELLSNRDNGF